MLEKLFHLKSHQTTVRIEAIAGLSTFLTMSYIIFVNPTILSQTGMDYGAVFVATCLAAAFGSMLMGLLANYPIALAPGMALNAYFTYSVVLGAGHTWQVALGAVFISGVIFLALSVFPVREYIINNIPRTLKVSIVAGIGLFLGIIGFKNAGIIVANKATFITLGNLHHAETLLAIFGFFLMVGLDALGIIGSIIISIVFVTILGIGFGISPFHGIFSLPPSLLPTFFQMDLKNAFHLGLFTIIFAFLFVDLFDNSGALIGVAHRAGLMDKSGKLPRLGKALIADSTAAIVGATLGTSTTTSYIESMIGVKVGGRTGLTAVIVGLLFLLSLFLSPLANSIPLYATAPALIYIACLMMRAFIDINWDETTEYVPAVITAITMPLTFSVADGIAFGFISYTAIKILSGRYKDLNMSIVILSVAFILKYFFSNH